MTNRREGREGREREGERDRERGSRAKPGIQLVQYNCEGKCDYKSEICEFVTINKITDK